ncbi:TIGR03668 family PPOX class F420-dependent oxidoreductase [Streptomyces albireticuli]|uniref:TIGR03668 family PPOX class F420-dependent oxidoreductase n=1 Tax=Streptomyces albireticuli TaxID=1940 RepID=A0A2A2DH57_9ACTN|nr:TIGR03668 family PPOX class F420-dependent oxidoreductase [Streptomyces albireticuli]MCD9144163.1 TIGR03668 family PPOX class F420-dependent oxidoreductase [Streptomyces albireticuli]MCD9162194.1 TIGR03668 family PPOX class F420-dependent oxidoreductase [Streptomyces albireticuli]MCD9193800.1 TIGR03668 family PPOX class F420-dependent oxidoreductase [Streptomyces albireticuli]PAU50816.1 TIGR03668 family PPOX class F420-dependent oxidoreductase [Streptomyces albireticuli]
MMLGPVEARARFEGEPVARLATADEAGRPHVVPITFALGRNVLYFAIDHKPKSTQNLRRLQNIRANRRVSVLVDHYAADWTALWWARADGRAEIRTDPARSTAVKLLQEKYAQYAERPPEGPVVAIEVAVWSGWKFTG